MTTANGIREGNLGAGLLFKYMRVGLCGVLLMSAGLQAEVVIAGNAPFQTQTLAANGDSEFTKLETYLRGNQLYGLLIVLYQVELRRQEDPEVRARLASQLSQLYSWSLNNRGDNFEEISSAWNALVLDFPDNIDSKTQVQVAFGHYRRAREEFGKWSHEGGDDSRRSAVHERFSELVDRAGRLIEQESKLAESGTATNQTGIIPGENDDRSGIERLELVLGTDESSIDPVQANLPQRNMPLTGVAIQSRYVLAWSLYYRAMTSDESSMRADNLDDAADLFRQLLQVPAGTQLNELRPQWFSLESEWICRLLTGLGMVSQARGQPGDAAWCFELLSDPHAPASFRQHRHVYRFQSMVFAGQLTEANEFLQTIATTGDHPADHSDLLMTAAMTGLGSWIHKDFDDEYQSIALTGMRSLVLQNNWNAIDSLLDQSLRELAGEELFANWLEGYRSLRKAQAGHSDQIRVAVVRLRAALEQTDQLVKFAASEKQFELRARCRYHLGFALYLDQQFPAAVEQFRQAVAVLKHVDRQVAEHGLWMQCQALERLAGNDAGNRSAFAASLKEFLEGYPDSLRVGDALFLEKLLQVRSQQPAEAIRLLAAIPPEDTNFIRARLELCRIAHEQWSQLDPTDQQLDDSRREMAQIVIDSASDFARLSIESAETASPFQQVRICLLAADVLVNSASPDIAGTEQWLSRAVALIPPESMSNELRTDWCYLEMLIGGVSADETRERVAVEWLVNNSPRIEHRRAAWLTLGALSEVRLEREKDSLSNDVVHERLLEVISHYANAIGDEAEPAELSHASLSALAKVAQLQRRSGQTQAAYESFQRLVHSETENEVWLAGLARTATELEKWPQAAELWRRIAAELPPGNNDWLESKYGVARCLSEMDRESALQVIQQTRLLAPDMPEPWSSKFSQLSDRVESEIEFN